MVIYGGDTFQDGTQCGEETKKRCEKAIAFISKHPDLQFIIILAAGLRPDKPKYLELKKVMEFYLLERLYSLDLKVPIIIAKEDGWGTFQETVVSLEEVQEMEIEEMLVVSSWYHVPRILFIWFLLNRNQIKVSPVFTRCNPGIYMFTREIMAFLKIPISYWGWKH